MRWAIASLVGLMAAAPALGCSLVGPEPWVVDPSLEDGVAPEQPVVGEVTVSRGAGPRELDDGSFLSTSCDDIGFFDITVSQPDDSIVGYRLLLVDGTLPDGFGLPTETVTGPGLSLTWLDGATDDQEAFDFLLEIIPVDAGGEEGVAAEVRVSDDGIPDVEDDEGAGCNTAGRGAGLGWLAVLLLLVRRRA